MKNTKIKNEHMSTTGKASVVQPDSAGSSDHPIDASQGSEFMDDAIRTTDQPFDTFTLYSGGTPER